MIVNGKKIAADILEELKKERNNYDKLKIAAFLIGKEEDKISFLKIKKKFAQELNIDFRIYEINESLNKKKIRRYISQILKHKTIQGAIFQLPIPNKFPTQYLLNSILPQKDIDCLTSRMLGKYYTDSYLIRPPAVEVVDHLKEKYQLDFSGKNVILIGYGRLIGKPLAHYFANLKSTVIIAQSQTKIENFLKIADVIISGVGKANLVNYCKKDAIIFDFGYSFIDGKIYGDVDFNKLKNRAFLITPTPGGTGPILVAKLFENFFKLLKNKKIIL